MGIFKLEIEKKERKISSVDEWHKLAGPVRENQWKDGRSAKELAEYILMDKGYFPKEIENILIKIGCNKEKVFKGEPEKITSLVGKGTGRHHDLFIEQCDEIVVGIEAKADENFKESISNLLNDKKTTENKVNRINTLYENLYGCSLLNGVDIRYQLLIGVSGILLEACRKNIPKALFLIITFKKEGSYKEKKFNSNMKDLNMFINSLSGNKIGDAYKFTAYPNVSLHIEHLEINIK